MLILGVILGFLLGVLLSVAAAIVVIYKFGYGIFIGPKPHVCPDIGGG